MTALSDDTVAEMARTLVAAVDQRQETEPLTADVELSVDDAYRVQAEVVQARLAAGERIIGAKLGLTSVAKQKQMGVDEPIFGVLTDTMKLPNLGTISLADFVHPRCEPEIVFLLAEDLAGTVTADDVLDATASVHGGIEVIDSRYRAFSFTLPDVIADNTSAARFAIGDDGVEPRAFDLRLLGCNFSHNGSLTGTATGAALLGDPAHCVAILARHMARAGATLTAGSIVLAGSLTDAVAVAAGDHVDAEYGGSGSVRVEVTE